MGRSRPGSACVGPPIGPVDNIEAQRRARLDVSASDPVAQWIERYPAEVEAGRSNRPGVAFKSTTCVSARNVAIFGLATDTQLTRIRLPFARCCHAPVRDSSCGALRRRGGATCSAQPPGMEPKVRCSSSRPLSASIARVRRRSDHRDCVPHTGSCSRISGSWIGFSSSAISPTVCGTRNSRCRPDPSRA
jgi:hypothetical protein